MRKHISRYGILALTMLFWCGSASVNAADDAQRTSPATDINLKGKKADGRDQGKKKNRDGKEGRDGKPKRERPYPPPERAWDVATIILGCPTDKQISMDIYPAYDLEGYIEYGKNASASMEKSETKKFPAKNPALITLNGLAKDTAYSYRFCYRKPGEGDFKKGPSCGFQTQRAPGSAFTFEIQGDSHPERSPKQNDPVLYEQTLTAVAKDRPDFFMCIGDDFSVDTLPEINAASVERVYLKQLPYLGLLAHSSALFLVNGNHEQAARYILSGTATNVAVLAQVNRNRFYPQPAPDGFYTGDEEKVDHIGFLRDYYSWTWGDALFVTIDPYWHSKVPVDNVFGGDKKNRDLWETTLGDTQYKWLKKTLEESRAKFKFVFIHHVNGTGRGGVEEAGLYEWGGQDRNGSSIFKTKRPGWELPIHQLMVKYGVTIFFQGHDHIFAKQEKDGVIYQTLPDPANPDYAFNNKEAYLSGDTLPGSGRVRVKVSPEKVQVEYVRSYLPKDATAEHPDGEIAHTYSVSPRK